LPLKVVARGDPYPTEVAATVLAVMKKLDFAFPYRLVWQSKVGPIPWLEPKTDNAIKGFVARGKSTLMLIPISFVNEHIETLHELDIEYAQDLAKELKIENIRRCPAPNIHPAFINGLAEIVKDHINSGETCSKQLMVRCPLCTKSVCSATRQWLTSIQSHKTDQ